MAESASHRTTSDNRWAMAICGLCLFLAVVVFDPSSFDPFAAPKLLLLRIGLVASCLAIVKPKSLALAEGVAIAAGLAVLTGSGIANGLTLPEIWGPGRGLGLVADGLGFLLLGRALGHHRWITVGFLGGAVFAALVGIAQSLGFSIFPTDFGPGSDFTNYRYRAFGTLGDPLSQAIVLSGALPLALDRPKWIAMVTTCILMVGLIASESRLAILVATGYLGISLSRKSGMAGAIAVVGVMLLAAVGLPKLSGSAGVLSRLAATRIDKGSGAVRLKLVRSSLELSRQNPWLGVGPGRFQPRFRSVARADLSPRERRNPSSHFWPLDTIVEVGWLGFGALLALGVVLGRRYSAKPATPERLSAILMVGIGVFSPPCAPALLTSALFLGQATASEHSRAKRWPLGIAALGVPLTLASTFSATFNQVLATAYQSQPSKGVSALERSLPGPGQTDEKHRALLFMKSQLGIFSEADLSAALAADPQDSDTLILARELAPGFPEASLPADLNDRLARLEPAAIPGDPRQDNQPNR